MRRNKFLGYKFSFNKIEPLTKRSESIINYSIPKTKKQSMRFLGVLNYDRLFIPNILELLKLLSNMIKIYKNKLLCAEENMLLFSKIKKMVKRT